MDQMTVERMFNAIYPERKGQSETFYRYATSESQHRRAWYLATFLALEEGDEEWEDYGLLPEEEAETEED